MKKLEEQAKHAEVWRDTINGYFYFKSGIDDEKVRLAKELKTMFPKPKEEK